MIFSFTPIDILSFLPLSLLLNSFLECFKIIEIWLLIIVRKVLESAQISLVVATAGTNLLVAINAFFLVGGLELHVNDLFLFESLPLKSVLLHSFFLVSNLLKLLFIDLNIGTPNKLQFFNCFLEFAFKFLIFLLEFQNFIMIPQPLVIALLLCLSPFLGDLSSDGTSRWQLIY